MKNVVMGTAMGTMFIGGLAMLGSTALGNYNPIEKTVIGAKLMKEEVKDKIADYKDAKAFEESQKIYSLANEYNPNNAQMLDAYKAYSCTHPLEKFSDYKPITHEDSVAAAKKLEAQTLSNDMMRHIEAGFRDAKIQDLKYKIRW